MQVGRFIAGLKRCHRKLVVNKLPGRVWGLSLKMPRHPDANEHGFVHLCSMPSPSWLNTSGMPPETLLTPEGQTMARGWKVILRLLVGGGHLSRSKVISEFGPHWEVKTA